MKIVLIRHGKTQGNLEKRYIGRTDEALCKEGIQELLQKKASGYYPDASVVYVSPMKRCMETANLLYPGKPLQIIEDLREIDFGIFEGKNYTELNGNRTYQKWIDSQCEGKIPGGESRAEFEKRCVRGFCNLFPVWRLERISAIPILKEQERTGNRMLSDGGNISCAFVIHGGTIMSLLHTLADPHKGFYEYQYGNGEKIVCEMRREEGGYSLTVCEEEIRI